MNRLIFITGGARSGKSSFAEKLSLFLNSRFYDDKPIAYIATAVAMDDEFRERILIHKKRRGRDFFTYEESIAVKELLGDIYKQHNIFLIECMTTWLGNLFHANGIDKNIDSGAIDDSIASLFAWLKKYTATADGTQGGTERETVTSMLAAAEKITFSASWESLTPGSADDKFFIIISNEVGLGIVPENEMGRLFRDLQGRLNQQLSALADFAYMIISGIAVRIR